MFKLSLLLLIASLQAASVVGKYEIGGDFYYKIIHKKVNWNDAFALCQGAGGGLATILSPDENREAVEILKTEAAKGSQSPCYQPDQPSWIPKFQFWIAGQRRNADLPNMCSRPFYWKTPEGGQDMEFTNWGNYQPDCGAGAEGCLQITDVTGFKWNDIPCHELMCALCKIGT